MSYYPYSHSYAANTSSCRPPPRGTPNYGISWQCKIVKPLFCIIIAILLSLLINHVSDKYSASKTLQDIKVDISLLRNSLNKLTTEVRAIKESRDESKENLNDISNVVPKLSEAIKHLRNELFDRMQESIRTVVKHQLQVYDADKTGQADYALQSSGGSILCTKDAERIEVDDSLKLFGMPICDRHNKPESIIQPSVLPGECWAFKGHMASVFIKLMDEVFVTGFSLEHIPASISPTLDNSAAPRNFGVWAVENPEDKFQGQLLGRYVYDNKGDPVQYFPIQEKNMRPSKIIELRVFSNSGHPNYTCIYRFRVHGKPTSCSK